MSSKLKQLQVAKPGSLLELLNQALGCHTCIVGTRVIRVILVPPDPQAAEDTDPPCRTEQGRTDRPPQDLRVFNKLRGALRKVASEPHLEILPQVTLPCIPAAEYVACAGARCHFLHS